jgi:beta-glucosidase
MTAALWRWLLAAALLGACGGRPRFLDEDLDEATLGASLPEGFLLGVATSAHQVEGGNQNDWTDWELGSFADGAPHIADGTVSGAATESFDRFDEDLALMVSLGVNSYRFSVEWSRLEPTEGTFDGAVADRYRAWAASLRAAGIEPMVTLHHFTLPRWVAAQGGWESDETVTDFAAFAGRVAAQLGAEVDLWCTLNEPNVYVVQGYFDGVWPPGKKDSVLGARVLARLLRAHARATASLRAADLTDANGDGHATRVGLAHHVRFFEAATSAPLDAFITGATDAFFNEATVVAARTGRIRLSVPFELEIDEPEPGLVGAFDYLGLNYYTRDHVRADLGTPALSRQFVPEGKPTNDLGWELYPEGLYLFLKRFSKHGWPIYVTENGLADQARDQRPAYLRTHLAALEQAAREGVDVRGYYHWSLLDNFEWAEGYAPKFGLYAVDFASAAKTRTPTEAVGTFQNVARNLGLR